MYTKSYLSLKLEDGDRVRVCGSASPPAPIEGPSGSSGTVVLFHVGNLLNATDKVHACVVSNNAALLHLGGNSDVLVQAGCGQGRQVCSDPSYLWLAPITTDGCCGTPVTIIVHGWWYT
jgi:hypothetical protein